MALTLATTMQIANGNDTSNGTGDNATNPYSNSDANDSNDNDDNNNYKCNSDDMDYSAARSVPTPMAITTVKLQ